MQLSRATRNAIGSHGPAPAPAATPGPGRGAASRKRRAAAPAPLAPAAARQRAARSQVSPAPSASPRRASAPPAAIADAARQYTGAFSGALNNLSEQQQRVADVASRRRADAERYAAYVMGQQGTVAAAAAKADQDALQNIQNVQGAAAANIQALEARQAAQNEAQGVGAPTAQMRAGLADDANRTQMLLGAAGTRQATLGNANVGRAQFLTAAAQANMLAHQRAISGDEFDQQSALGREKTGVLVTKTQESLASKRAQQAAAADVQQAMIDAESDAADRASREGIASAGLSTRERIEQAKIENQQLQGRANRRVRLKTAKAAGKAGGISPSEQRQRGDSAQGLIDQAAAATGRARELARDKPKIDLATREPIPGETRPGKTPTQVRAKLYEDYPGISAVAVEAAIDAAFPTNAKARKRNRALFKRELARRKRGQ